MKLFRRVKRSDFQIALFGLVLIVVGALWFFDSRAKITALEAKNGELTSVYTKLFRSMQKKIEMSIQIDSLYDEAMQKVKLYEENITLITKVDSLKSEIEKTEKQKEELIHAEAVDAEERQRELQSEINRLREEKRELEQRLSDNPLVQRIRSLEKENNILGVKADIYEINTSANYVRLKCKLRELSNIELSNATVLLRVRDLRTGNIVQHSTTASNSVSYQNIQKNKEFDMVFSNNSGPFSMGSGNKYRFEVYLNTNEFGLVEIGSVTQLF